MTGRADRPVVTDEGLTDGCERNAIGYARIDWSSLEPLDSRPTGLPSDTSDLQPDAAPLEPARERVDVAMLYPERLTPADAEESAAIAQVHARDRDPVAWVTRVNPRFREDLELGDPGHTTNCADAARAFQEGLDGRPRVAARIARGGLPAAGDPEASGGEASIYTEQWAGERFEPASYDAIENRVRSTKGSAIVHAVGPFGGHAFNLYFEPSSDRVRYADAQRGTIGDLRPRYEQRFPHARAIYFDGSDR